MTRRLLALLVAAAAVVAVTAVSGAMATSGKSNGDSHKLGQIDHIVVIYEENHSFDNLYGGWEGVNGLKHADPAHTTQIGQTGARVRRACTGRRQPAGAVRGEPDRAAHGHLQRHDRRLVRSHFPNAPFQIDDFIWRRRTRRARRPRWSRSSSPNGFKKGTGSPGGCTRDIVHRFYEEQFQLNGGQQNRYVLQSDAAGLVDGHVRHEGAARSTSTCTSIGHPHYAILDDFFQGAFGGSFLNHQWLIAAAPPVCNAANGCPANATHSVLDAQRKSDADLTAGLEPSRRAWARSTRRPTRAA